MAHWSGIRAGDEVVLLPIGEHARPTTHVELWGLLLQKEGVDLFGERVLVATVTGLRAEMGQPFLLDVQLPNGTTGSWPADKVLPVDDLAPIGMGIEALERWLDS